MKIRELLLIALCAFLFLLSIEKCGNEAELIGERSQLIKAWRGQGLGFDMLTDGIARQRQLVLEMTDKQSRQLVESESLRKEVKRLQTLVGVYVVTEYDTIILPVDSAEIVRTATANLLKLPYSNTYESRWLNFRQTIDTAGRNTIHDLTIEDSLSFHIYTAKRKLKDIFRPRETRISMKSENPYTKLNAVNSLTIKQKRSFASKPLVNLLAGFVLASVIFAK